ncbi:MAG TPA: aminomethyl-transferring glycine dehydrogenase subunit GcvPA [Methylococcaceae bacterium]|nr:aminomethyl-transferring glycine dehydrogenase subunit GcvPA [Methylococcaceae bacterium]
MPFIPHTREDVRDMLAALGVASIEDLFDEIPPALRCGELPLPPGLNEMQVSRLMQEHAAQNRPALCFAGAGAYEHHVPAAVWEVALRGEFYSAYTPYQAEASQGTLQVLYEYQTMMAGLTALEVSNASLYDGASALAEALLMAVRANRQTRARRVLIPKAVHPAYRHVVHTLLRPQQIEVAELPYDGETGRTVLPRDLPECAALVIPQPNFFGVLEEVDNLTDRAHRCRALAIALVNPTALALLRPPGEWGERGADIACGDGQPLGLPLAGGGPYFGFLCCRKDHVHHMPGRLVGRTLDAEGKPGFTLTLQAREQHIRRAKATSNICTNQGLMVTAATLYMALLGPEGLKRVAENCHANTREIAQRLTAIPGVRRLFEAPFFHEVALRLNRPAEGVLAELTQRGILGGYDLSRDYPELGPSLLVCATETRSAEDIAQYATALGQIVNPV